MLTADRESPSFGGMYSGHMRLWPGALAGTTWPGFRLGVIELRKNRPKSHANTNRFMICPIILLRMPILAFCPVLLLENDGTNPRSIEQYGAVREFVR